MSSQVTVPLSHLINVLHSLKSSVGSSSSTTCKLREHKSNASDSHLHCTEVFISRGYFAVAAPHQMMIHFHALCLF